MNGVTNWPERPWKNAGNDRGKEEYAVQEREWARLLKQVPLGIYILTVSAGERINGMVASWVTPVSHHPPLLVVAVHPDRYCHELVEQGGGFCLHVLDRKQAPLMDRFKGPDPSAKFHGISWRVGKTGSPVLDDCLAYAECEVRRTLRPGNHTLFLGEVVASGVLGGGTPLCTLDYAGVYTGKA
ncbi:MAG: flavin reductase [Deltaproteobacteria bacterium]|nr:flavin reductase [Deltaproteobacteria bacterium]